ncbi:MAG: hypothetical protein R6X15_07005 [Pseudomonadota bacterium]
MDVSFWLSITATILSIGSFGFTVYNILRDRGRILATSEIFYDNSRALNPGPSVLIRVVNSGRRPIVLTKLVRVCSQGEWASFLSTPSLDTDENGYAVRMPASSQFVAQNTAVRLPESGVYEQVIHHDDYSELHGLFEDDVRTAKDLYFEDVLGRRYRIKDAEKNLSHLYSYEEPKHQ